MQEVLAPVEVPPVDLPNLLQSEPDWLVSLANAVIPGIAESLVEATVTEKVAAFAATCQKIGCQPDELLVPGTVHSAEAMANSLAAFAREASARSILPPLKE